MAAIVTGLIFAIVWAAVTGSLSPLNLVLGFLLGLFALWIIRRDFAGTRTVVRPWKLLSLLILFVKELALSAWRVAVAGLPRSSAKSATGTTQDTVQGPPLRRWHSVQWQA